MSATPISDSAMEAMERNHTPSWPKVVPVDTARDLEREVAAWRARFPQYVYRPQDECVALK
jgi:hypothetical protein